MIVSEHVFARQVEDLFKLFNWTYYHTWLSTHSQSGFPDYFAVRGCRALAIELKSSRGQPSAEQVDWLAKLAEAGQEAYCFWPEQFDDVVEILR